MCAERITYNTCRQTNKPNWNESVSPRTVTGAVCTIHRTCNLDRACGRTLNIFAFVFVRLSFDSCLHKSKGKLYFPLAFHHTSPFMIIVFIVKHNKNYKGQGQLKEVTKLLPFHFLHFNNLSLWQCKNHVILFSLNIDEVFFHFLKCQHYIKFWRKIIHPPITKIL